MPKMTTEQLHKYMLDRALASSPLLHRVKNEVVHFMDKELGDVPLHQDETINHQAILLRFVTFMQGRYCDDD